MADMTTQGSPSPASDRRHELRDINLKGILVPAGCLLVSAIIIHLALWGMLALFHATPHNTGSSLSPLAQEAQTPPPPRLQESPRQDMIQYRAEALSERDTYGWADKNARRVRIPVERAKELFLRENSSGAQSLPAQGGPRP